MGGSSNKIQTVRIRRAPKRWVQQVFLLWQFSLVRRGQSDPALSYWMLCSVAQSCLTLCSPIARHAPLSMEFSRQEYWSGLPFPIPGDLPDPGVESTSLASPELTSRFFTTRTTWSRRGSCVQGQGMIVSKPQG